MKRMAQSGFGFWKIILATALVVLFFAAFTAVASADTYYVATTGDDGIGDGSSGNPWRTIQHAVNTITEGDTIIVRDGTYTENVYVNKDHLTIKSEKGAASTIVQAENQDSHVFAVTADYVNISGFTVEGATGETRAGIILNVNDDYCTISNNDIVLNEVGILLQYSSHNTVINNNINSNQYGIWLYKSGGNMITNNNINSNHRGIYMRFSYDNKITENTFKENAEYGLYMLCYKDYDLVVRCNGRNKIYHNNFVDNFLKPQMYASDSLLTKILEII
jgi:parallel beta-helix repeat protein